MVSPKVQRHEQPIIIRPNGQIIAYVGIDDLAMLALMLYREISAPDSKK